MLPIPPPATDPFILADWLELQAVLADDKNASFSELRRALGRMGIPEDEGTGDEKFADDAFSELEDRLEACRSSPMTQVSSSFPRIRCT